MDAPPIPEEAQAAMHKGYEALLQAHALAEDGLSDAFVDVFTAWWDHYERFIALVAPAFKPECKAGCNNCCQQNPRGVSGVELYFIHRLLRDRPDAYAVRARFKRRMKTEGGPCPLLDERGWCSVYAARPVPCRMFFAATPPDWCHPEHPKHQSAVTPHLVPSEQHALLLEAISQRLGLGDLPTDLHGGMVAIEERLARTTE